MAVQLTVVFPTGKIEPEAGVALTTTGPSTRSVALAEKLTTAPAALVAVTTMSTMSAV